MYLPGEEKKKLEEYILGKKVKAFWFLFSHTWKNELKQTTYLAKLHLFINYEFFIKISRFLKLCEVLLYFFKGKWNSWMSSLFKSGLGHRKLKNYWLDQLLLSLSTVQNELFIAWGWSPRSYDAIYISIRRTPTVSEFLCISGMKTHLKTTQRFLFFFFPDSKHLDPVLNTTIFN